VIRSEPFLSCIPLTYAFTLPPAALPAAALLQAKRRGCCWDVQEVRLEATGGDGLRVSLRVCSWRQKLWFSPSCILFLYLKQGGTAVKKRWRRRCALLRSRGRAPGMHGCCWRRGGERNWRPAARPRITAAACSSFCLPSRHRYLFSSRWATAWRFRACCLLLLNGNRRRLYAAICAGKERRQNWRSRGAGVKTGGTGCGAISSARFLCLLRSAEDLLAAEDFTLALPATSAARRLYLLFGRIILPCRIYFTRLPSRNHAAAISPGIRHASASLAAWLRCSLWEHGGWPLGGFLVIALNNGGRCGDGARLPQAEEASGAGNACWGRRRAQHRAAHVPCGKLLIAALIRRTLALQTSFRRRGVTRDITLPPPLSGFKAHAKTRILPHPARAVFLNGRRDLGTNAVSLARAGDLYAYFRGNDAPGCALPASACRGWFASTPTAHNTCVRLAPSRLVWRI